MVKIAKRLAKHRKSAQASPDDTSMPTDAMFELELADEDVFVEALVELEDHNVWVRPNQTYSILAHYVVA